MLGYAVGYSIVKNIYRLEIEGCRCFSLSVRRLYKAIALKY
ncbi:hypothetical protein PO124_22895 [Bacillus licheniformis]|nr:hypothetical protein [Bacillus licheniformis]